jgi:hypothetical protein
MNNEYVKTDIEVHWDDDDWRSEHYTDYYIPREKAETLQREVWRNLLTNEDYYGLDYYKNNDDPCGVDFIEDVYLEYAVEHALHECEQLQLRGQVNANIVGSVSFYFSFTYHMKQVYAMEEAYNECENREDGIKAVEEFVNKFLDEFPYSEISFYDEEEE